jgi:ketosteroid isomerase-like protein
MIEQGGCRPVASRALSAARHGLLVCLLSIAAQPAADDTPGVALTAFHAAAASADLAGYLGLLTDDVVFLGTDASERWEGEAFRAFVRERFSSGTGWTYRQLQSWINVSPDGSWARFDELLQHDRLGTCRGSGLLVRSTDGWRIAQYNLSVPIPNHLVLDVAQEIRGDATAGQANDDPVGVSDTPAPERCRKRHKTNRRANC